MTVPRAILSEQLSEVIKGRRVRTALFTTFTYDPGFFELQILPLLFPHQSFSVVEKVRRIQLEDALPTLDHLVVYYDGRAVIIDGEPSRLGCESIPIKRRTGVFHPKLVFLLVDESDSQSQSLIVCCQSANITRSGWWENVECAHFEELNDKRVSDARSDFKQDLLDILEKIEEHSSGIDCKALNSVREFVTNRVEQKKTKPHSVISKGPRLFGGSDDSTFTHWLTDENNIPKNLNLEVISPYFDGHIPDALNSILKELQPRETRVYLPQSEDGASLVTEEVYKYVEDTTKVHWASIPSTLVQRRGASTSEKLLPRFVHAKLYRFWSKRPKHYVTIVGSVNCTRAAHGNAYHGNLEAAWFLNLSDTLNIRELDWWLETLDQQATRFIEESPNEDDETDNALFDVAVQCDWETDQVKISLSGNLRYPIEIYSLTEELLFTIEERIQDDWKVLDSHAGKAVRQSMGVGGVLRIRCDEREWRILVQETNSVYRPSILLELTPEEILRYWSFLSPEQKMNDLERKYKQTIEGLSTSTANSLDTSDTVFFRFSGIFHAFGHFRLHIKDCLENQREEEAQIRLFGRKYDSMSELLRKLAESKDQDPLMMYVTFLAAKQILSWLEKNYTSFLLERQSLIQDLTRLIDLGISNRKLLKHESDNLTTQFFEWYEEIFLREFTT